MSYFPGMQDESFNAEDVAPSGSYSVIPAGKYTAVIESAENKMTKANDGEYLSLKFKIVEGDHANRVVWCNLNLVNKNPTAVEIARGDLSAICRAIGVLNPESPEELLGIPLVIKVSIRKESGNYPEGNDIKGYSAADVGDAPW